MFRADSRAFDRSSLDAIARSTEVLTGTARTCHLTASGDWGKHRLLPICLGRAPSTEVRRFVRGRLRWSPSFARSVITAPTAVLAASRTGVRVLTAPLLAFDPPLDQDIVIQVGARRIRAFDLEARRTAVVDGAGRSSTVRAELAAREVGEAPFFSPLIRADPSAGWLLEAMVDGLNLARHPPWRRRGAVMERGLAALSDWAEVGSVTHDQREYADALADELRVRSGADEPLLTGLVERTGRGIPVSVGPSHGDLQQGNLLYDRNEDRLWIVDFEHYAHRSSVYDRAVLLAGIRKLRLAGPIQDPSAHVTALQRRIARTTSLSTTAIAVVLLEELMWRTNQDGPILRS